MLTLSKKNYHAIEAVLYIACNGPTHPSSSKEIAKALNLPPRYLEQIMQKLVRFNILESIRGPNGGYLLARESKHISAGDVCEIITDDDMANMLYENSMLSKYILRPMSDRIQEKVLHYLKSISLAELCEQAAQHNIGNTGKNAMDYTI